ncbi:hypothetical protein FDP41_008516 [Naegleria fowleri]|uniref:Uncharacterized protein n=1 Tax=Naegleria fowleri TaxID=5763 RepID=A0A6A5BKD4_NAEFO|nr:uncharacterized protein FDP41_008516 [Naegleria fowleri]KAF0973309.1 hypothetical protein FDP41_008516 [Naegleria fowleri]
MDPTTTNFTLHESTRSDMPSLKDKDPFSSGFPEQQEAFSEPISQLQQQQPFESSSPAQEPISHQSIPFEPVEPFPKQSLSKNRNNLRSLVLWFLAMSVILCLVGILCFSIGGALFGVVNADPELKLDPNALMYVHRNCCVISDVVECTSTNFSRRAERCRFNVTFPLLGIEVLTSDPLRGNGVNCFVNNTNNTSTKWISLITTFRYSSSKVRATFSNQSYVSCYTNKEESKVAILDPISELYEGYTSGAIATVTIGSVSIGFVITVGVYLFIKMIGESPRRETNKSQFVQ